MYSGGNMFDDQTVHIILDKPGFVVNCQVNIPLDIPKKTPIIKCESCHNEIPNVNPRRNSLRPFYSLINRSILRYKLCDNCVKNMNQLEFFLTPT